MLLEDGIEIVRCARKVIEDIFKNTGHPVLDRFLENAGVFVTLSKYPKRELRGCIGYPEPIYPLNEALILSAKAAALEDPRFQPLREDELDSIVVEVTILTPPEEIVFDDPEELPEKIEIGRDGLIAEFGHYRGLLLPQVPVEYRWDREEFLAETCMKAGLGRETWRTGKVKFYKFQGQIFAEKEPNGEVVEVIA